MEQDNFDESYNDPFIYRRLCSVAQGLGEQVEYSVITENGRLKAGKVSGPGGQPVAGAPTDRGYSTQNTMANTQVRRRVDCRAIL